MAQLVAASIACVNSSATGPQQLVQLLSVHLFVEKYACWCMSGSVTGLSKVLPASHVLTAQLEGPAVSAAAGY